MENDQNLSAPVWHTTSIGEVESRLNSDLSNGLTATEARSRLTQFGPNTLIEEEKEPFWKEFIAELREPMVLMLLITGVLYAIWGEISDAITIFVIILTLNTVEVVNEQRSKKAIASLRKMAEPVASVNRDGHITEINVEEVVPGDLVLLQTGRRVPADARLVDSVSLAVDESALTGESLPVEKSTTASLNADAPLAERSNMVYSYTLVTRGKGAALVVSTGMHTEVGRIASIAREVKEPPTPLQTMMDDLSKSLVWFALGFSLLVPLVGIFAAHQPPKQMLLTGLSLAFATIPEEMPIIITMVLALGAYRLSKKHAIVKRLNAVETLGSVTVIATDKTGTLTENRMEVVRYEPAPVRDRMLEIGVVCSDAVQNGQEFIGDPLDAALLRAAQESGLDIKGWRESHPVLAEFPFDNTRKLMSVVYRKDGKPVAAVKGAPEMVLSRSQYLLAHNKVEPITETGKVSIQQQIDGLAAEGLRVMGFAERALTTENYDRAEVENGLTFVGLAGLFDPPRAEAADAIATCRRAGVRVMMVTGDHPFTASSVGRQVGLDTGHEVITGSELDRLSDQDLVSTVSRASIFARAAPEHKLRIVRALQSSGERVAVTGDGVNDAPALSAADIGVAMGETGTDVAREAADMVLADDNFTTIVNAVEEGRLIYENLKKGVRYYLACKLALVLITLIPALLLIPVPFAPIQIILMELFMDLMAAAAFVAEGPEANLLDKPPRDPKAKFMDKAMIMSIVTSSVGLFAAVTFVYLFTWYGTQDITTSQTVAFFGWMIGHVFLAFNMRSERQPILQLGLGSNRMMLLWAGLVAVFLVVASFVPKAGSVMKITSLSAKEWIMIIAAGFIGTFWSEVRKLITFRRPERK